MAGFTVSGFEHIVEIFARTRSQRTWEHVVGSRAGLGLERLYEEDLPSLTSLEQYIDLHEALIEDSEVRRELLAFLAATHTEGRTLARGEADARWSMRGLVDDRGTMITPRAAGARLARLADVPARHDLEGALRQTASRTRNDGLWHWRDELAAAILPLGDGSWNAFWDNHRALHLDTLQADAGALLETTAATFGQAFGAYLGLLELPLDDAWLADMLWAFRGVQFDRSFSSRELMPIVSRAFSDLGISLREQTAVQFHLSAADQVQPGVHCVPLHVPQQVHVSVRLVGGFQDYANVFQGVGQALHRAFTDAKAPVSARWLGDRATTLGYGLLVERLLAIPRWREVHLENPPVSDFNIVFALSRLYRCRRAAALLGYERRLWDPDAPENRATDFEETLSSALRIRHFGEDAPDLLGGAPWSAYQHSAVLLRAEMFAAQLARYLRREFDEEWWRNPRTGTFLVQELWRPGRRFTAEQLLGYMGEPGFDPSVLSNELQEVVRAV